MGEFVKFSFELPREQRDLVDLANFLVQKASKFKQEIKSGDEMRNLVRFEKFNAMIAKIDENIEIDEIKLKRYEK